MKATTIIVLAAFLFLSVMGVMGVISLSNSAMTQEKQVVAQYDDMKNVLGQYSLKVSEAAQVPSMYKDDVKEVFTSAISGRYGKDGSKAMFQFLKEHNPNIDASLYKQIQQIIESGRNAFENKQRKFIDEKRQYETMLGYAVSGTILRMLGYPKINLAEYKIIESVHGQETFKTGVDKGMQLR